MQIRNLFVPFLSGILMLLPASVQANTTPINSSPIYGTVQSVSDSTIKINSQTANGYQGELVFSIAGKETKILDATTGYPINSSDFREGDTIYAYVSSAMTASAPPIVNAAVILGNIPQDYKVPAYIQIQNTTYSDSKNATILTTITGQQYTIPGSCSIIPYLTKNFVTVTDLTKDRTCLIWSDHSNQATKVVLFPKTTQSSQTGWSQQNGKWYYYHTNGSQYTGWLEENDCWYYLDPSSGVMQTGFLSLNGNTYYLEEDGKLLTTPRVFSPDENGILH